MTSNDPEIPQAAPPQQAVKLSRPATTGDTVTVACKLPHGLILRIFEWEEYQEPSQNGGWKPAKRARELTELRYVVRGAWAASAGQAFARNNPAVAELLPGGYALTHGVPADIWDRWYEQNRNTQLVKSRIIFAQREQRAATQQAVEHRHIKSGLEPLDRENPAERMPGGVDRRLKMGIFEQDPGSSR